MIQAHELRIGNWILYNGNQSCVQFVTPLGIQLMERNSEYPKRKTLADGTILINVGKLFKDFNELEPIPLTEEILLKCGFEKYQNVNYKRFRLVLNENRVLRFTVSVRSSLVKSFDILKDSRVINLDNDIIYLHQLQNLYFALTGKELEVRL